MACLIIPGLNFSGPGHWQTRWLAERDDSVLADLGEWTDPTRARWVRRLEQAISALRAPPVLVAHSLGCLAVAWWAAHRVGAERLVAGALLVAPPDVDRAGADVRLRRFAPVPVRPMPFPAILVASRDDPYSSFARSRAMASGWSARLHDAGVCVLTEGRLRGPRDTDGMLLPIKPARPVTAPRS